MRPSIDQSGPVFSEIGFDFFLNFGWFNCAKRGYLQHLKACQVYEDVVRENSQLIFVQNPGEKVFCKMVSHLQSVTKST